MDFDPTPEQEVIHKEVRRFAEKEIASVALDLNEREAFPKELTRKMDEISSIKACRLRSQKRPLEKKAAMGNSIV